MISKSLKKLAGQTAIYGLSSIVGRFLNYLLVPLYLDVFSKVQYGIITEMYSYVAFLVIFLTYGMETAFFRFGEGDLQKRNKVFSSAFGFLLLSSGMFILLAVYFSQPIANWLKYPRNNEFVIWFAIIVGLDAISTIPQARLRQEGKPLFFALVNLLNVVVNIGLNLFFLAYCMPKYAAGESNWLIQTFYNPEFGVSYVFISNLIASVLKFLVLMPMSFKIGMRLYMDQLKVMIPFAIPILLYGLAGNINETIDRILFKRILFDSWGESKTLAELGVYGANYKLSIIITLFIQAFRYAAEPFFFSKEKDKDAKLVYAQTLHWFALICSVLFLVVMLNLSWIKYFLRNQSYWEGLHVVPILLLANVFLGLYYSQSIWYKITNKTYYGATIAGVGAVITLVINIIWIPTMGYLACAWATVICYFSMLMLSFLLGAKHYPVPYQWWKLCLYVFGALLLYFVFHWMDLKGTIEIVVGNIFCLLFALSLLVVELKSPVKENKNYK